MLDGELLELQLERSDIQPRTGALNGLVGTPERLTFAGKQQPDRYARGAQMSSLTNTAVRVIVEDDACYTY